jgi:trk system potassium uptake protein TrkA
MNVLVVGCGKVGTRLAEILDHFGHNVAVVDSDEDRFSQLSDDFDGITVAGMPMDMAVLRNAGVEGCDAVAAVTADDNLNITVSQIVRKFFGVRNVVARINDPAREVVYNHLGLKTICSTKLTCSAMFTALTQPWEEKQVTFDTCTLAISMWQVEDSYFGKTLDTLPVRPSEVITGVLHNDGNTTLYDGRQKIVMRDGDRVLFTRVEK